MHIEEIVFIYWNISHGEWMVLPLSCVVCFEMKIFFVTKISKADILLLFARPK